MFDVFLTSLLASLGAFKFLVLMAFVFVTFSTVTYKFMSDQVMIKHLRDEMKKLQEQMKKSKDDQKKMMDINKKLMSLNGQIFSHSWKSNMLPGLLFAFLILPWLHANLAYAPLQQDVPFNVTVVFDNYKGLAELSVPSGMINLDSVKKNVSSDGVWYVSGKEGKYLVSLKVNGKEYFKDVTISNLIYAKPVQVVNDGVVKEIRLPQEKRVVLPVSVFGWNGWFATYFYASILFSIIIRKLLRVY